MEEFDIEDIGEMEVEKAKAPAAEEAKDVREDAKETREEEKPPAKKKSPFRGLAIFFGVLFLLLVAGYVGMKRYRDYVDQKEASAASESVEEEAREEARREAERQQEAELLEKLSKEHALGMSEGEQEILDRLRESIEGGASVVETLRKLYVDQLVVASGGTYHFIPIRDDLKKNDYLMQNLVIKENGELQYQRDGSVVSYKGIDVSKFQGKIDWKQVAQDGVTFTFIRVGYRGYGENGVMVEDPNAKENMKGANDAGIKTGVYYYTQAITEAEALEEANAVLEMIAPYRIECPIVIDVERVSSAGARMNKLDAQTRTKIVKTFCDRIAEAGYRPMIYHNLEMAAVMLDISELEAYDKWFAYYNTELYYPYAYRVWQYSDKGRVAGISGDVDLNIAFEPLW